jgi:hypothetical protein
MKNLIAFVGFKSSGKNTAAEALLPYGYVAFSFADALKDALATIFCWDRVLLEGITQESRVWRETVDQWWADKLGIPHFTPRWAMQNFGTDVMRRHFHEQIWVFHIERRIMMLNDDASVVLTDARFPNEIMLAKRYNGKVIRIRRGPEPIWMDDAAAANWYDVPAYHQKMTDLGVHASEYAWIGCDLDATIENDGSIAVLQERLLLTVNP